MKKNNKGKGLRQQMEESTSAEYSELNIDKLTDILTELQLSKNKNGRKFIMWQGCKTYGMVERTSINLNICEDETCVSCQGMVNAFHEGMKEYVKKLKDEEE